MDKIEVFSPGSVSNLGSGFDIFGFALNGVGDHIIVKRSQLPGVHIGRLNDLGNIPEDPGKNVAAIAVNAMLDDLDIRDGVEIYIKKGILPGSGIGSSAASSAGAVVAVNELLGLKKTRFELVTYAMKGEEFVSGSMHADNVAPACLGGLCLIRSYQPLDIVSIPVPNELQCVLLHPQLELPTKTARDILKPDISLKDAVKQWGNVSGITAGFFLSDYELIGKSMEDFIIEPQRASLIPHYYEVKEAALKAGALGFNISGAGPSMFALCKGIEQAEEVKNAMKDVFLKTSLDFNLFVSEINAKGVSILNI